jgi:hypothetical protein
MNLSEAYIMKYRNDLTAEYVRECLDYDPETGLFTWKTRPVEHFNCQGDCNSWNARFAGKKAGKLRNDNYIRIKINNADYFAHRIAWLIVKGKWPDHQIDHADGIRNNNKIDNLSDVPNLVNGRNRKLHRKNKTGHSGIYFRKDKNVWEVKISNNNLGTFKDLDEAVKIRKAAEIEYGYHENHGRIHG